MDRQDPTEEIVWLTKDQEAQTEVSIHPEVTEEVIFVSTPDSHQSAAEEEVLAETEVASGARKKTKGKGEEVDVTQGRLTGYDQFSGKLGIMNLEAIEKAAEEAEEAPGTTWTSSTRTFSTRTTPTSTTWTSIATRTWTRTP